MKKFQAVYIPVGVPTFHLESAQKLFDESISLLKSIDEDFIVPEKMLLDLDSLREYMEVKNPDAIVFQNLTFANGAYMTEVLRQFNCPVLLWTLREPVIDGTRLRLNSLTGAYSAANTMRSFGKEDFEYIFGSPKEAKVIKTTNDFIQAAKVKHKMRSLKMAAIGHTPEGFGFGRALDNDLSSVFGVRLEAIEARELINKAKSFNDDECADYLKKSECCMCGLENTAENNRKDYAKLCKAYFDYVKNNNIGALATRCWPDFFTDFGTPVCSVLAMLNDAGIASACEADIYGALSMWVGMQLSKKAVFFGDPVSLNEEENTITYWHCGTAACSLARKDTGAAIGVHPNRKIGPAMDFGCEAFDRATVFRIGREADGSFRFFIMEGKVLDKPKQFTGTSIVVECDNDCRAIVEDSVYEGFEPHFVVIMGGYADVLCMLANMYGFDVYRY